MTPVRTISCCLALLWLAGTPAPAAGQAPPPAKAGTAEAGPAPVHPALARIKQMNEAARQAFSSYSYRAAQTKLDEALDLALKSKLDRDPALAETHMLAGVTSISGFNDLYRGLHYFVLAMRLDPAVKVPNDLATPQLMEMFKQAQQAMQAVGNPPTIVLGRDDTRSQPGEGEAKPAALGLIHTAVDTAKRGFPVPLKAQAGIDVQAQKVFLYYRMAGEVKFRQLPMRKSKDVFRASIPAEATDGRYLHYYIEAMDPRGRPSGRNGSDRSPNVVIIK